MADCNAYRQESSLIWGNALELATKAKGTIDKNPIAAKETAAAKTYAQYAKDFSYAWKVWSEKSGSDACVFSEANWNDIAQVGTGWRAKFKSLNDTVVTKAKEVDKRIRAEKNDAKAAADASAAKTENDAVAPVVVTPTGVDMSQGAGGDTASDMSWMLWAGGAAVLVVGAVVFFANRGSSSTQMQGYSRLYSRRRGARKYARGRSYLAR
jgi:hypothetical protein